MILISKSICFTIYRVVNNGNPGAKSIPQSTTNVHDWVWLGRATLEKAATHTSGRSPPVNMTTNNNNSDMRITENPFSSEGLENCFDNSKYIENGDGIMVDTSTYCKNSGRSRSNEAGDEFENFSHL